ncbi:universal stress protein [Kitasatospora sp. NPDC048365]|uniref:universal stress protein n=1 Tax=Kitasatospora sp. NPDC048365 TaxID=3364050 RepID=UPI0037217DF0
MRRGPALAFEQAAERGMALRAVQSRTEPAGPYTTEAPIEQREIRDSLAATEQLRLQDTLARWREKFPEVRAEAEVIAWSPARSLAEASRTASLLVVGRRTGGHPMGTPGLGPVARAVLHRAHCPVAVVPHD